LLYHSTMVLRKCLRPTIIDTRWHWLIHILIPVFWWWPLFIDTVFLWLDILMMMMMITFIRCRYRCCIAFYDVGRHCITPDRAWAWYYAIAVITIPSDLEYGAILIHYYYITWYTYFRYMGTCSVLRCSLRTCLCYGVEYSMPIVLVLQLPLLFDCTCVVIHLYCYMLCIQLPRYRYTVSTLFIRWCSILQLQWWRYCVTTVFYWYLSIHWYHTHDFVVWLIPRRPGKILTHFSIHIGVVPDDAVFIWWCPFICYSYSLFDILVHWLLQSDVTDAILLKFYSTCLGHSSDGIDILCDDLWCWYTESIHYAVTIWYSVCINDSDTWKLLFFDKWYSIDIR